MRDAFGVSERRGCWALRFHRSSQRYCGRRDDQARTLKELAAQAGIDTTTVSGHSCHIGMAQDLVASGAELPAVMQAGRGKWPAMPARYAERLVAGRGAVARFYGREQGK